MTDLYRIKCGEILGGNRDRVADVHSASLASSVFSSACGGGRGGDIYYFSVCDSDILTRVAIADVTGHGAPVSRISDGIYRALRTHMNSPGGDQVLSDVNRYASARGISAITTASVIGYYSSLKTLFYSYAGHHPLLLNRAGTTRWTPVGGDELPAQGAVNIPLAVLPDAQYRQFHLPMDTGDRVLLYTDGVTELRNAAGEEFGIGRLLGALAGYSHLPLSDMRVRIVRDLHSHANGKLDHDDVTLIFAQVCAATGRH